MLINASAHAGARRAQDHGLHAAALRPLPGRAARHAAAARRHPQAAVQGGAAAEGRRQVAVHAGADPVGDGRVRRVRHGAVRRRDDVLRPARRAGQARRRRRQRRRAGGVRHHLDGRLRHRPRRLVVQQQVLADRRPARLGADDQLRAVVRDVAGGGDPAGRLDVAARGRGLRRPAPGSASSRSGTSSCSRSASSSTSSPASPRPTARRSTFPEAEQELVAGYNTEYSSVRFALFPQAEYINMATMSAVATDLYLGGWHGPVPPAEYLGWIWFLVEGRRASSSSTSGCAGRCRATATTS